MSDDVILQKAYIQLRDGTWIEGEEVIKDAKKIKKKISKKMKYLI